MTIIVKLVILIVTAVFFARPSSVPEIKPLPTEIPSPTPTQLGLTTVVSAVTSIPKVIPKEVNNNKYIYTNGTVVINTTSNIKIESEASPDDITLFYKNLFKKNNSKVKSFVTTKTNGNILNKLVGIIDGKTITIEIKKDSDSKTVYITLTK